MRGLPMTPTGDDHTPPEKTRESFEARLRAARRGGKPENKRLLNETTAFGIAFRMVAELVSGLVVGGGIGWLLDRWLGTSPWLLVVFFVLGAAAGIMNVFRAAREMNAVREKAEAEQKAEAGNPPKGPSEDGGLD